MSEKYIHYGKIIISIVASYILTTFLVQTIFLNPLQPYVDKQQIAATTSKLIDTINIFKPKSETISKSTGFFDNFSLHPAQIQQPTSIPPTPIVVPTTVILEPTTRPTIIHVIVTNTPPPTRIPTNPPPQPTNAPAQTTYNCPSSSDESYGSINSLAKTDRPAESHPDLNIHIRGYVKANETKQLVELSGETDNRAPQLTGLLAGSRFPAIANTYKVYDWNWSTNSKGSLLSNWPTTLVGLSASVGQEIKLPPADYDIGGAQAMVLYAEANTITIKYTAEDNVIIGYALHLDDICVDPNLLAKYREADNNGRNSLPALSRGKKIGTAKNSEVKIAIRDSGEFMDPRSQKDWWAN